MTHRFKTLAAALGLLMLGTLPAAAQAPSGEPAVVTMGDVVDIPFPAGTAPCDAWFAANGSQSWILYVDGQPVPSARAWFSCPAKDQPPVGHVRPSVDANAGQDSRARTQWMGVLDSFSLFESYGVDLALGPQNGQPQSGQAAVTLRLVAPDVRLALIVAVAGIMGATLLLIRSSEFARDPPPPTVAGVPRPDAARRPYSLSRVQLLWWSGVVLASYAAIYLSTSAVDSVTTGALVLMGIAGGTSVLSYSQSLRPNQEDDQRRAAHARDYAALAAKTPRTDADRQRMRQLQERVYPVSQGFLPDILTDAGGFTAHRLQLLAWTVVLGAVFLSEVLRTLAMPDLSANLLALTGISNGTYFGFKMQETQVPAATSPADALDPASPPAAAAPLFPSGPQPASPQSVGQPEPAAAP